MTQEGAAPALGGNSVTPRANHVAIYQRSYRYEIPVDETATVSVFAGDSGYKPRQWLDKVRANYRPAELSALLVTNT